MAAPHRTIELLNELQRLGFDDGAFSRLHHFRLKGRRDTIEAHRKYVVERGELRDGDSNEELQRRLEMVLKAYRGAGFTSGSPFVFAALAEATFLELPPSRAAE